MYQLSEFTQLELRIIGDLIADRMDVLNNESDIAEYALPEGDVKADLRTRQDKELTALKEINVRVLTSLQIVRDKDKEVAN